MLEHFLAREPTPIERIERMFAGLTAMYHNTHLRQGASAKAADDFLPYLKAWPEQMSREEYEQTLADLRD